MTPDEARKVLQILLKVDGGCPVCAKYAVGTFIETFPQYAELAREALHKEFD